MRHLLLATLCCTGLSAADISRDALDRVTRVGYPDGSRMDYAYDAGGNVLSASYSAPPTPPVANLRVTVAGNGTASITVSGVSPLGTVAVRIFVDGVQIGVAVPSAGGDWSFALPALSGGAHGLSAAAVDAAGSVIASSDPVALTTPSAQSGGGAAPAPVLLPPSGAMAAGGGGGGGGCGLGGGLAAMLAMIAAALRGSARRRPRGSPEKP